MGGQNLTLAVSRENSADWLPGSMYHGPLLKNLRDTAHRAHTTAGHVRCTRQPTATERAGARAALRIRRATPYRCCRRWRGGSGERRRPLADQRGDAVQAAAAARDKSSSIRGAVPRLLAKVGSAHSESFAPSSHVRERTVTVPS